MKCDRCGLESAETDVFQSATRLFFRPARKLCPACVASREDKVLVRLLGRFLAFLTLAVLLTLCLPSISIGAWLLNIALLQFFVFISTIIHEVGHAGSGYWAGLRVFGIEVGRGRLFSEFKFGGLRWQFRSLLSGGCARGAPRDPHNYRLRASIFILGGPLANVILLLIASWSLPADDWFQSGIFQGLFPMRTFLLCNVFMLALSLWPRRYGKSPNDMLLVWETLRRSQHEIERAPANWYYLETLESQWQGRHEDAGRWLDEGLRRHSDDPRLQWLRAGHLMELGRHAEARKAHVRILGRHGKCEELRFSIFNAIAYGNALAGDSRLFEEAEVCSRLALEHDPRNVHHKGTRGCVLMVLGEFDSGRKLLLEAVKEHPERRGQALGACHIAIAEARRGNRRESDNFFSIARRLDPKCALLERQKLEKPPERAV